MNYDNSAEKQPEKRRRLQVGDPDFAPPDGGWGWLVVFACGFSNFAEQENVFGQFILSLMIESTLHFLSVGIGVTNSMGSNAVKLDRLLSTFPMFQQFGLLFREKYENLGITNAETTTIININSAFNASVGLLNGPVFRRFTYRQVALFGASLVAVSLFLTTFCSSFWSYLIIYSVCYGSGIGITQSSNALALNTYFKKNRRIATGLSWSTTGLGPIVWPYIITVLMSIYETEGTLLIFSAFAGHAIVCSLLLQPVNWHTAFRDEESTVLDEEPKIENTLSFSYDVTNPGTPRMIGANDGYYSRSILGSKLSLATGQNSKAISTRPSYNNLMDAKKKRRSSYKPIIKTTEELEQKLKEHGIEKDLLKTAAKKLEEFQAEQEKEVSFFQKICIFFDFNLLKDPVYLNLMLGITIANFAELNFSVLTPFVLKEFNFDNYQIATFMSLLGATDILVRLIAPFIAGRIGWDNKTFFLCGVLCMAFGRIVLVHTQTYSVSILVAIMIGFGKGLRTIFMALVIPSYVPLERLPAASGLQLATSGILFLLMGPVIGWVRDLVNNYVITLHLLNIMTYITTVSWTLEKFMNRNKGDK